MVRVTAEGASDGFAFCAGCNYIIGVHGWQATEYTITAAHIGGTVLLQDGVTAESEVLRGEYTRFKFFVADMRASWLEMASALSEDGAPAASLDGPKARAAPYAPQGAA